MLFRHGANAKQVQVWLGHHSPAFTLATYVHLLPDDAPDPNLWDAFSPVPAYSGSSSDSNSSQPRVTEAIVASP